MEEMSAIDAAIATGEDMSELLGEIKTPEQQQDFLGAVLEIKRNAEEKLEKSTNIFTHKATIEKCDYITSLQKEIYDYEQDSEKQ